MRGIRPLGPIDWLMKFIIYGILSSLFCASALALAVHRVPVAERIENSSLVIIGTVLKDKAVKGDDYLSKALVRVSESSRSDYIGKEIAFYHSANVREEAPHCCGIGATYVLFLKPYKDGFITSADRFSAYEIIDKVPMFLDETWMRTSLEHAEILLYLHQLSCQNRDNIGLPCS